MSSGGIGEINDKTENVKCMQRVCASVRALRRKGTRKWVESEALSLVSQSAQVGGGFGGENTELEAASVASWGADLLVKPSRD